MNANRQQPTARWNPSTGELGELERLTRGLSADDREQCLALWSADRVKRVERIGRHERESGERAWTACLVFIILSLVGGTWLASYPGPDAEVRPDHIPPRVYGGIK